MSDADITVAIPSYRREQVLVDTVSLLLAMKPAELLVVDQSESHERATDTALRAWEAQGAIRWLRPARPSIPGAMNVALLAATRPLVLFVDDDIVPDAGLLAGHLAAHRAHPGAIVAGRVLQPWHEGRDPGDAPFAGTKAQGVDEFMGGNFSLAREAAIAVGGFDENFVKVAYRFEAEFAHRWLASGRAIQYEPAACLHHLKAASGGTRSFGEHLTTWRPDHAVGAYYWGLRTRAWRHLAARPVRSLATRFHLRHPWCIPATLAAELGGMLWATKLYLAGPRLLAPPTTR